MLTLFGDSQIVRHHMVHVCVIRVSLMNIHLGMCSTMVSGRLYCNIEHKLKFEKQ